MKMYHYRRNAMTCRLKTLLNIVEARFKKQCWNLISVLYNDVSLESGIQQFWNYFHYPDIYDLLSPFNKPSGLWFILTQQSMGEIECGKSGCLLPLFEARNAAFEVKFFRTSFSHLIKDTGSM